MSSNRVRKRLQRCILYNRRMAFIPAFSEPQSHWPRDPPPPPFLRQSGGEARAAGVAPPRPAAPGEELGPISGSYILPHLYKLSDTPATKIEFSRVDTAPHSVETPVLRADR